MLFTVIRHDKANKVSLRQSERPKHLVYLERVMPHIKSGGALLNDQGQQIGSILIIDVESRAAAEEFACDDPYVEAGLFERTDILPFHLVFAEGKRVA
jgi:uncharacterized protein YciI